MKKLTSQVTVDPIQVIEPFRVTWKELNYTAQSFGGNIKRILKDVSGYFQSGQVTAIMGPSGCGKSTLLGIISGQKRKGLTGSITISTDINVKFAFIVQENIILEKLTVRESILFASKLKNESNADHNLIVDEVIDKLLIKKCAHIKPNLCSGGQLKRALIGIELVAKPNILILDEPTSGLDSVTTWQLINTLIELTQQSEPVSVVITIHQPSAKLFNLFNNIYLLSHSGECIYFGGPLSINKHFSDYGLNFSVFTNPSDFALEVASGEHDPVILMTLALVTKIETMEIPAEKNKIKSLKDNRTLNQIYHLTHRVLLTSLRDPFMMPLRFFGYVICGSLISILYGSDSGVLSGCDKDFTLGRGDNLIEKYKSVSADIFENYIGIAFVCIFGWFAGIFPVLLQFPIELNNFLKEYNNGFYSCFSYFTSIVLGDLPFCLLLPNLGSFLIYYMTGQCSDPIWRVFSFAFIFILITFSSSALGFLLGALLAEYPTAIAFLGMISLAPLMALSGIMIRLVSMPLLFQWLTYFNYLRFGLVSSLITIYGFGRCADQSYKSVDNQTHWMDSISAEQMLQIYSSDKIDSDALISSMDTILGLLGNTEDNRPLVFKYFSLYDTDYAFSVLMLFIHIFVFRSLTYLIILKKIDLVS